MKRMPSFAYSIARLRVIASSPPFVTIGTEAFTPAIGCSTIALVMQVTLPPVFCWQHLLHGKLGEVDVALQIRS